MKKGFRYLLVTLLITAMSLNLCGCFLLFDDDDYYDDYDDYDDWDDDEGFFGSLIGDWFSDDDDWDDDWDDDDWGNRGSSSWHGQNNYSDWDDDDDDWGNNYSSNGYDLPGNTDYSQYTFGGRLGSAKEIEGTTVVVSVFLNDKRTSWNFNSSADIQSRNNALTYMKIATDWITKQCARYGTSTTFIYNWNQYPDLYFEGRVSCDMTDEDSDDPYYDQMAWIDENVDSQSLMDKYGADDIIYMLYINTPLSNECVSATYNYAEDDYYPYEVVSIYVHSDGEEEAPAAYAHEILHTYGAPDLYLVDTDGQNYGISQEFVDQMERTSSNDIMYTTYDCYTYEPYYNYISNEFSDIDAYYVGLIDDYSVVREWGFERSQH